VPTPQHGFGGERPRAGASRARQAPLVPLIARSAHQAKDSVPARQHRRRRRSPPFPGGTLDQPKSPPRVALPSFGRSSHSSLFTAGADRFRRRAECIARSEGSKRVGRAWDGRIAELFDVWQMKRRPWAIPRTRSGTLRLSDDPRVDQVAELFKRGRWTASRAWRYPVLITRTVWAGPTAIALLGQIPTIDVYVDGSSSDRFLQRMYSPLIPGFPKLAQAALPLPKSMDEYLAGGSKRTVRKKLVRAARNGIEVREVTNRQLFIDSAIEILARRGSIPSWFMVYLRRSEPDRRFVAYEDQNLLAFAVVYFGTSIARLDSLVSYGGELSSAARFSLHSSVVETAIAEGVQVLVTEGGLRQTSGSREFAHQLGYGLAHIRLRPTPERAYSAHGAPTLCKGQSRASA
jgi:hypothetical protein